MSLTPLDKKAVRRAFDRAAPAYDKHAILEQEVESRLFERLEYFQQQPGLVLDLGCGTGSASRLLASQYGGANIISLDWSPAMLAMANPDSRKTHLCVCADMHELPVL